MRLLDFGGAAAEAAQVATHHTTVLLDDHAGACEAVARAAEKAADEVTAIKMRLQLIRDAARGYHLMIDDATGTALPPPDLSSYSPADQQAILNTAIRLTEGIKRLLADAETADEDLAAAIRGAAGDLSPEQVNAQLSHQPPTMPQLPPRGSDPEQVKRWWHSL
ncbi:hypothetical protein MCAN_09681, partial [Mycobacterium canettii CIPT 140010059]